MHYFKRNIGDYHKKAGRLSMLQHGAYTLLIDACYDREQFPTLEDAIDWCWASSPEEIAAVEFVLKKFFKESPDGRFIQNRIQEEIDHYHEKSEKNRQIAIAREEKKRSSTKRGRNVNETPPNQEPRTNNQEPKREGDSPPSPPAPKSRGSRLPDDWQAPGDYIDWATEQGLSFEQSIEQGAIFADYWKAQPGAKGRKVDWKATWRNWIRRSKEFKPTAPKQKTAMKSVTEQMSDTSWREGL